MTRVMSSVFARRAVLWGAALWWATIVATAAAQTGAAPTSAAQSSAAPGPEISAGPVDAETRAASIVPSTGLDDDPQLVETLLQGERLEKEGRWREALHHYEEAVRQHPSRVDLHERLALVRVHFDLIRRMTDPSYLELTRQLSPQQALEVFSEVAAKVEAHHVADPDWTLWMVRGTDGLLAALGEQQFVDTYRVTVPLDQRQWVGREIRRMLTERKVADRHDAQQLVAWAAGVVQQRLGVPQQVTMLEYSCSFVTSLDNYSSMLTPAQLDEVYSQIEGNFVGLGVELKPDGESLLITSVIPKGPAERAGMRDGDRIVGVSGQRIPQITAEQAADLLKGEIGTTVHVDMLTSAGQPRSLDVVRDRVEVPSVQGARMVDPEQGVAYLRISSFQKTTSRDTDAALWKLYREGMRSLIVDVRGNPGGLLNESVDVADKFVTEGTIVRTRGRVADEDIDFRAHRVGTWGVPLVVLIDGDSASASEIFASAIRDHQRGTIVGQRSYGKGSVQGIFPLRTLRGGLRLTTAKFYSPSGQAISYFGVHPDVTVQQTARVGEGPLPEGANDPMLEAAIQVARQQLAKR